MPLSAADYPGMPGRAALAETWQCAGRKPQVPWLLSRPGLPRPAGPGPPGHSHDATVSPAAELAVKPPVALSRRSLSLRLSFSFSLTQRYHDGVTRWWWGMVFRQASKALVRNCLRETQ